MGLLLRRALASFLVGALLGTVPFLAEIAHRGATPRAHAAAGFCLLVGGLAAALSLAIGVLGRGEKWAGLPLTAAVVVTVALLLFYVNVVALPDVGLRHPRSLATSAVVVAPFLAAWGILRRTKLASSLAAPGRLTSTMGALVLAACALATLSRWPPGKKAGTGKGSGPDLAVITLDAVRRDHLGLYGYPRATSPELDALSTGARVFESAFAASSWTRYSVPAILKVEHATKGRLSVTEILNQRGYSTACFSDNPLLEEGSSLSAGFQYVGVSYGRALRFLQRVFEGTFVGEFVLRWPFLAYIWSDERLASKVIAFLQAEPGPVFLYVHLMDAHMPYKRPAIDGRAWSGRRLDSPRPGMSVSREEAEDVVAHYDGALRYVDAQVKRVVQALEGRRRPWLIIVTADHGESLGEGGRWGHGKDLGPEVLGVPLLTLGPSVQPGRARAPVGHASIAFTLLRAAGEPCDGCLGVDLRTADGGGPVRGSLPPDLAYRVAVGHKLILNLRTGQTRLFDLATDPLEGDDLSGRRPDLVGRLARGLSIGPREPVLAPEDLERMRALGYLGSDGTAGATLPEP